MNPNEEWCFFSCRKCYFFYWI